MQDVVRELGYLTLGSRFKRIGERLQAQAQEMHRGTGVDLSAAHYPVLAALDRLGALKVGEISQALGISQPAVTRMLEKLESEGLVQSRPHSEDRRAREIELSKAGSRFVTRMKASVWAAIEAAVADACRDLQGPLLTQLAALEEALDKIPLTNRRAGRSVGE